MRLLPRLAYSLYAGTLFLALGLLALGGLLVTPDLSRRRGLAHRAARALLRLIGMPCTLYGTERLPAGQCIVVANHESYLDGIACMAALPPRFSFVIKREMATVPLAGTVLRRIGSEFVERFKPGKNTADALRVLRSATGGDSLVFFPEGTFSSEPGLGKFQLGAFTTAVRAGCPVVPAVIRGTRRALAPDAILLRPAQLSVELLPALRTDPEAGDDAAQKLCERARTAILRELQGPDRAAARARG